MAGKLNEFATKFGKGGGAGPPGLQTGIKLLAVAGAAAYGISQSVFTGNFLENFKNNFFF